MKTAPRGWAAVGHDRAITLLSQSITASRISHAYLISGPRQVGKTTLALDFARALNCPEPDPPCGQCRTCKVIAKGVHPDVRVLSLAASAEVEASSGKKRRGRMKNIPIDEVRGMLRDVALAPYEARWKVYILRYAEDLTLEAIQVLLKTLEEPPAHVVLTLTTVDAKILPLTVVSRCQQIELSTVARQQIELLLRERYGAEVDQAKPLARHAAGRPGWAIEALRNPDILDARAARLSALIGLASADRVERMAFAERLASEFGRDPETAMGELELWLCWWRDLLLTKVGAADRVVNYDRRELTASAESFHIGQLFVAMQSIKRTLRLLEQNVNPRLALECLAFDVPRLR